MSSLELILNAPTAYGAPGGANAARVQNDVGDLCLWSSNQVGMRISAVSGYVGVGKTASYALDVSGGMYATGLYGCITDSLVTTSSALAASATGLSNVGAIASAALPRAGGTVSGALTVIGSLYASNVTVLGSTEVINAYETHSSNLVITNLGTGPALTVTQTEGGTAQPVAAFYAGIGAANPALMVTNAGQVGIGKSTTGYALDVSGSVNVSGTLSRQQYAFMMNNGTTNVYNSTTNNYTIAFNSTIYNIGSCYNTSTYTFTAPISGLYLFCTNTVVSATSWIAFMKNGSGSYWYGLVQNIGTANTYLSTSQIIQLNASDTINVICNVNQGANGNCFFSGTLLA